MRSLREKVETERRKLLQQIEEHSLHLEAGKQEIQRKNEEIAALHVKADEGKQFCYMHGPRMSAWHIWKSGNVEDIGISNGVTPPPLPSM